MILSGYIIDKYDYKENDLIVKILTDKYGIINFIVPQGKNKEGLLDYFNEIEFLVILNIKQRNNFDEVILNTKTRITEIKVIKSNFDILKDKFCFLANKNILKILKNFLPQGTVDIDILGLNELLPVKNYIEYFKLIISYLSHFGIYPDLYKCTNCGKTDNLEYCNFKKSHEVEVFCSFCNSKLKISTIHLGKDFFKIINYIEHNPLSVIKISDNQFYKINNFFDSFLKRDFGISFEKFSL